METGNPNFPTNFKGRYEITPTLGSTENNKVMLSSSNIVEFMGNWQLDTYTANGVIGIIPDECIELVGVHIPICITENSNYAIEQLHINNSGEMYLTNDYTNCTLFLRGINYNISGNYY